MHRNNHRRRRRHHRHADEEEDRAAAPMPDMLPLVVSLNCLEDTGLEQDALAGLATVEHVDLGQIASGKIEAATAVLVHSLAFLPRAAQRRIQPWQLVLCLGSADRSIDSTLAADLGLRLVHVDVGRAEEVADTVMALFLGLLRRTHVLSRQVSSAAAAASGWLGSVQPLCRGMRRCRGLVLGIVGRTASARFLATRSLAFSMSVLYFDCHYETEGKAGRRSIVFPPAARRMDTLNDLLAASDLISLHCTLSNETFHIINAECLQHIKPGAFLVNSGSSQLIDDCALKQLLIDGTVSGCALDGAEGPQWMEAWIREMPNVLILPRSADYSEEVWMEIRDKTITLLQQFLVDGVVPDNAVSEEDEDTSDIGYGDDQYQKQEKEIPPLSLVPITDESQPDTKHNQKQVSLYFEEPYSHSQVLDLTQSVSSHPEGRCSHSGKKGIKRPAHRRSRQKSDDLSEVEGDSNSTSQHDDDTATSGRDQVVSPENSRNKQICLEESTIKLSPVKGSLNVERKSADLLKDGYVIALYPKNRNGLHVSRQRLPGGGWFLDTMSNVTKRDPAAQFLVTYRSKDIMGLRSLSSGGKLLQINRRMEFVFASHNFDVWESWMLEGSQLEDCRLVNCRNSLAVLDVRVEIVATVGEQDGITRWID